MPRESILKEQLEESLLFINERLPAEKQIVYIPWDFHEAQKKHARTSPQITLT